MQMYQCVMCKIALLLYSDCRSKHVLPSSVFSPGFYQDQGVVGCGATGGGGGGGEVGMGVCIPIANLLLASCHLGFSLSRAFTITSG